jgi:hypothetical protein
VQLSARGTAVPDRGSRLDGTVVEMVYLGMYTQFHVDTAARRIVSHRLADELLAGVEPGSEVTLSWEPEQAYLL